MAELVDALDSKSGYRKVVQVRFLFWALRWTEADLNKDRLQDAPRYADNDEPDYSSDYNQQVYTYYGVTY